MLGKIIRGYAQGSNTVVQGEVTRVLPSLFIEGKIAYLVEVQSPYKIEGIVYKKQATVYHTDVLRVL